MNNLDYTSGILQGPGLQTSHKTIADLKDVFLDEAARAQMNQASQVYKVMMLDSPDEHRPGGLLFGTSFLRPGTVGGEYFMTRGHFHALQDRAEMYWCYRGTGLLILMDQDRGWRIEEVSAGTVHYIPGKIAHRLVNTGKEELSVGACWPSDAGHDYQSIKEQGFSVRVFEGPVGPVFKEYP